jgi:hypothetical protein
VVPQDALQKLFAGAWIRKPFFVLHRQVRQRVDERLRKEPAPGAFNIPVACPRLHPPGPVVAAADADQPDTFAG